ncbi:hypothetical protein RvY_06026 [Ramazzottius varieornatus]|uniref:Uncharacterized protein n=1 Tax=Ramazzottius varieornatus TaxID=947166 RepID=A0A1D1UX47_RAMVA|nr:hypothetical protein RvY_06026 [Ramazzottius varieornatus]
MNCGPRRPYEPSLAELVDNIRRNLESTTFPDVARGFPNPAAQRWAPVFNRNNVPQRLCPFPNNNNFGQINQGGQTPRNAPRSRDSSSASLASMGDNPESLLQAAANRLSRQNMGLNGIMEGEVQRTFDQRFNGPMTPDSPSRGPGLSRQNSRLSFNSSNDDLIARELAAACNFNVYGRGSRTPSEIASEETYELVDAGTDWDQLENDAWTFMNNPPHD